MDLSASKIVPITIEEEMKRSYINYAMSVIVERALPDVRDGLKPVQRRILYGMKDLSLWPDQSHRKSARIVGDVMGKYHPHGDSAIYDAMVRMAQPFSYRYMLVDAHGNFGSIDGDPPAAMRYTEARLSKIAMEMLRDIDKETVDFEPNFDDSTEQPSVMPARFPNLLVNGASGIAVGMATNIPPHNLGEIVDALIALIDDPDLGIDDLMKIIKGPDFPTGALILGRDGIEEAYRTGRGRIRIRAKSQIEQMNNGRTRILVTEIPYMVNKATMIEKIAELVREKRVEGITDLRDESDKSGIRVVMELKREANPHVVLNRLYKHTQLQDTFGVILLALVDNEPKVLTLRETLVHYLEYQRDVIIRRCQYELRKAEAEAHLREGYLIALDNIDAIIALIRRSENDQAAKVGLMEQFDLSERQAVAILDMQLRRLTSLEREKIEKEYAELLKTISRLQTILGDMRLVYNLVREELCDIRDRFSDERRTRIIQAEGDFQTEDLIADEDIVVTMTHQGYIKRLPMNTYRAQKRGGRGISALHTKTEDLVEQLFVASTHSHVLFFTNQGRVYRLRGHEIPEAGRNARGTSIINLIQLQPEEQIQATIPVAEFSSSCFLLMATRNGVVKKTSLDEFDTNRVAGLLCITLDDDDELVSVRMTDGDREVIMVTAFGQAIRFLETEVRSMGRIAHGVKGIRLQQDDSVVGMDVVTDGSELLVVTEQGYGKRTPVEEYRRVSRGGKGVRGMNMTPRIGPIVGISLVQANQELMLISKDGIMIRMAVGDISSQGRNTQGVRLMKLGENDRVIALAQTAARINGES